MHDIRDFLLLHQAFQSLDSSLQDSESQRHLATVCINYLGYKDFRESTNSSSGGEYQTPVEAAKPLNSLCTSYPFLEYAVYYVFGHAAKARFVSGPVTLAEEAITSMQQSSTYGGA